MTDAEREAQIRHHVAQVQAMAPYDAENVQGHVTFLFRLLDEARAEIARLQEDLLTAAYNNSRLQAPPGASAMARAQEVTNAAQNEWAANRKGIPTYPLPAGNIVMREHIARAIEQAEARARRLGRHEAWGARHAGSWEEAQKFMPDLASTAMPTDEQILQAAKDLQPIIDAAKAEARAKALEDIVTRTSQQIAVLGGVLMRNPCRDEILRALMTLNQEFRALAKPSG